MILRAGLILTGSNILAALLNFARNVLIARLISPEDFGVAATFLMTASVLDLLSNMSVDRLIVQARDGDDPKLVAAIQGIHLARNIGMGAIIFAISWPMAWFFGHDELVWAYQLVAVIPLLKGFGNVAMTRQQRSMNFGPTSVSTIATSLVALVSVWPLAMLFGDYRVMLGQMILGVATTTIVSHLLTEDRFRLAWDWSVLRRTVDYGWPLLINGGLLFIVMQGDRMVIGNQLGPLALGLFSAALTLAMMPSLLGARIMRLFFMPLIAKRQDDAKGLGQAFLVTMQTTICAGLVLIAGVTVLGPPVFHLAYGEKYAGGMEALLWLGVVFGIRLAREGASTVAMSCARTTLPMYANLVRLATLPIAFWAAGHGARIEEVVMISAVGEAMSFVLAMTLTGRWLGLTRLDRLGAPYALLAAASALGAWIAATPHAAVAASAAVTSAATDAAQAASFDWRLVPMAAAPFLGLAFCAELRGQLRGRLRRS